MPVVPEIKNSVKLVREMKDKVSARTAITSFERDSKTRVLFDLVADQFLAERSDSIAAFRANTLDGASGNNLVIYGDDRGIPKRMPTYAESNVFERNFAFYVQSGTFGDINGGADLTVSAGTILYSSPNENQQGAVVKYEVTETTVCGASSAIQYIGARAVEPGIRGNVGAGVIRHHEFTNYVDSGSNSLKVVNFYSILNGRNEEEDTQYKYRISQKYSKAVSLNDSKIKLVALDVPGLIDVQIIPGYYGIGTAGVVVLGAGYEANDSLIAQVQSYLKEINGTGRELFAVSATLVQFYLELEIKTLKTLTIAEKSRMEYTINQYVIRYFKQIGINGAVDLSDLAISMQKATNGLLQFKSATSPTSIFSNVYIARSASRSGRSNREQMLNTSYSLDDVEYPALGSITFTYV
jgi:uncharacterized phage protein gp47/JayE